MTDPHTPDTSSATPNLPVPQTGAPQKDAHSARRSLWRAWLSQPWAVVVVLALLLAGWQWLETRGRLADTQQELARRLNDSDTLGKESRALAKQSQEEVGRLQAKVGVLETQMAESQGQQAALENLYQELARNRDDWVLADAEHSITLAVQQLQLAGNVPAAIVALQAADARLARVDRPHFVLLRKALNRDLERLKALPFVDLSGMSLRLENMVAGVDALPLAADSRPRPEAPAPQAAAADGNAGLLLTLGRELWDEFRALLRIQRLDRPEPVLLPPEQNFFLRENLKLRLLNARLALFAREQWSFRNDLKQAQQVLERYFDTREKSVQGVQAALKQLLATDIVIDLPNLNETLTAMRNSKASKEVGKEVLKDGKGRK